MDSNELLFAEERKNEIVKLVNSNGKAVVPSLVEYFKVSPATIRNDLRELVSLGLIQRTHGGAIPIASVGAGFELDSSHKMVKNLNYKQQIAIEANKLIDEGDIIILDTGTTTLELAKLLTKRSNITIIVNDIEIAGELEESDNQIILIGGSLRKKFHCTVGPMATKMLSGINVDKIFLGTNAFSIQKGGTTPDINQAEIKSLMIDISNRVHLLCDSSKIGNNSFVQFAPIEKIDVFITDQDVDSEMVESLDNKGIEVIVAAL
jgi:DeoR family fructose operon transcriptional repressor